MFIAHVSDYKIGAILYETRAKDSYRINRVRNQLEKIHYCLLQSCKWALEQKLKRKMSLIFLESLSIKSMDYNSRQFLTFIFSFLFIDVANWKCHA